MKVQQLIELIQEQVPDIGEKYALTLLNQAQQEFAEKTGILRKRQSFTTDANVRNYTLPGDVIRIRRVLVDNNTIGKLMGYPVKEDTTEGTMS